MIRRLLALALLGPSLAWADAYGTLLASLNPCAAWRMNAPSGTTETCVGTDASSCNGTYVASPTLGVTGIPGTTDTAVTFDNSATQYMKTTGGYTGNACDPCSGGSNHDFSAIAWLKTTSSAHDQVLIGRAGASKDYALYGNADATVTYQAYQSSGNFLTVTSSGTYSTASFKAIGVSYVGSTHTAKLYLNGAADNSSSTATGSCNNVGEIDVARRADGFYYVYGTEDEPAIFGTALTAQNFSDLYNCGNAGTNCGTSGGSVIGRRIFQSRRAVVDPYLLPVTFGPREPQPFPLDVPTFVIDALNARAIRSPEVYAQ